MTKFLKNVDVTGYVSQTDVTSSLLKTDSNGKLVAAVAGTDYQTPTALASADRMVTVGRNATGATLYKGTIVYISGSTGNRPNFVKSQANAEMTSAGTFGVVYADIPNNTDGQVLTLGTIDTLDTRSTATNPFTSDTLADGDTIYLSPTTPGYITNVKPSAPNHLVYIGKVTRTSPTNGTIVYRIQNGYEMEELHNVAIASVANNEGIFWESATSLWKNKTIAAALGYTPYNASNPSGYISSITSGMVTTALGYTPYNASNPSNYIPLTALSSTATGLTYTNTTGVFSLTSGYVIPTTSSATNWDTAYTNRITSLTTTGSSGSATLSANTLNIPTYTLSGLGGQASSTNLTSLSGLTYASASFVKMTAAGTFSLDTNTYYLASNPSGYISGITSGMVTTALGYTPYNSTNPSGYITGITSSNVTSALGYTPYNATNPSGYITSSGNISGYAMSLSGYSNQTIYTILTPPANYNGPVIKVRYDSATANRYIDIGTIDGNGTYSEGFKIYNGGTPTWVGNTILHAGNYNSYSPTLTGGGASGTWGVRITGFANAGSQRLYSTDTAYNYDSANPYYGYLTYDGTYWQFKVTPASPDKVRVYTADTLTGYAPNQSSGAYTIVQRDANGYIQNSYFYTSGGGSERNGSGISYVAGFNSSDYYIRSYTMQAIASAMSGASMNINGSSTSCTGNAATASTAPYLTLNGVTGGITINEGRTGVFRTESGSGGTLSYAPLLHVGGGDTMWQIQGAYGGGTNLQWRSGYAGTWYSWWTILHTGNYSSYALPITGGTVTGVTDFGTDGGGSNNTGIGIRYSSDTSGYGRIRFYQAGTNNQTIHVFSTSWQSGTIASASSGAINIAGSTGTTFGDWNNVDAYIVKGGQTYARGYRGIGNVAGTGEATYHPAGIYSTGTNWLYGTMYLNGNTIRDTSGIYNNDWFRNNNSLTGLYNQTNGNHFYSRASSEWSITGAGANVGLVFRSNHESTIRGYVYGDTSNNFGFLGTDGNWVIRITQGDKRTYLHEHLVVGYGQTSSNIWMYDADETTRRIHCNSNRIGFLNSSDSWGAWCENNGAWSSSGRITGSDLYSGGWVYSTNNCGWYNDTYGQGLRQVKGGNSTYGNIISYGENYNGWAGFVTNNNIRTAFMQNSSGDHGFFQDNDYGWSLFFNRGNACWGIGTDNTYSGDGFRCIKYGSAQYGWTTWSDRRAKENISTITGALDKVLAMRGVNFNYIIDEAKSKRVGFIAQELIEVLPEAVRYAEEIDEYNVEYGQIVSVLAEAIKEQNTKIQTLEAQLQTLLN